MSATPSRLTGPTMGATVRDGSVPESRLRRRLRGPLVVLGLLILASAGAVAAIPDVESQGTLLGASGPVSGGIARINGVIPLETDGWLPDQASSVLTESAPAGTHRVRVILELTALDPDGLEYRAGDYSIQGWGSGGSRLLWADPKSAMVAQGGVVTAIQVFEIPNQAIELTLRADESRFSLGTDHHTR